MFAMPTVLAAPPQTALQEVLVFTLGGEEYGVNIEQVQELRGYDHVTTLPNCAQHIKGVVHLRGQIVPIIDLRIKLGCALPTYDQFTVVVILLLHAGVIGVVVDSVSDVTALTAGQIKAPPAYGAVGASEYVVGLAVQAERMLILVDIERLLHTDDLASRPAVPSTLTFHEELT